MSKQRSQRCGFKRKGLLQHHSPSVAPGENVCRKDVSVSIPSKEEVGRKTVPVGDALRVRRDTMSVGVAPRRKVCRNTVTWVWKGSSQHRFQESGQKRKSLSQNNFHRCVSEKEEEVFHDTLSVIVAPKEKVCPSSVAEGVVPKEEASSQHLFRPCGSKRKGLSHHHFR